MPPKQSWTKLAEVHDEDEFVKYRWKHFCCSAVFWVRTRCVVCPGDHEMAERRLRCKSPDCKAAAGPGKKCPVIWKVHQCLTSNSWVILSNAMDHSRGDGACSVLPRPKVTREIKEYIQRMDENAVPPRLIWSNMLRVPEISTPVLGFPTCVQVLRSVKYNRWLQGSKNSILRVRELVRARVYTAGMNPDTSFVFGNREDEDVFPFVGNGEDEEPLIIGITSLKLMQNILALQARESFLIFHLDATFKLSGLGYPVITCGFTDRSRKYHLAGVFIVSQRTQREYHESIGSFARVFRVSMKVALRVDAVMGDADDAQLNGLRDITELRSFLFLMCFFHVMYNFVSG